MIFADIIEQKRYSFNKLSALFKQDDDGTKSILKKLKEHSILKLVKSSEQEQKDLSDLVEEDVEVVGVETLGYYYIFTYVGILVISNLVIKCYPKYLKNNLNPQNELKQIIKVIEKYNSENQIIYLQNEIENGSNINMLPLMLYFINDYYNNGLYSNSQNIIETNGDGEVLWEKTINENYALIQNDRPYYVELYTKKVQNDDLDYFRLLHEVILTQCSKELEQASLLNLFELTAINLNFQSLDSFGDKEHILYKINQELDVQFNSHKQTLLKAMFAFISHKTSYFRDVYYLTAYGTNSYNLIWEKICGSVLSNKKDVFLGDLELPNGGLHGDYDKNQSLGSIIEKPTWFIMEDTGDYVEYDERTLMPDAITFNNGENGCEFIIFDAKYYNWPLNKKPGIGDVTKQYLYELAYKEFIELNGFVDSKNCFLFPTDEGCIKNKGYVELKMLKNLSLKNIQIRLLPAKRMNQLYLDNKQLDISELDL